MVFPTGTFSGSWCLPELVAAVARGVTIDATHHAIVTVKEGRIVDSFDVPFGDDRGHDLRYEAAFAQLCGEVSHALRAAE